MLAGHRHRDAVTDAFAAAMRAGDGAARIAELVAPTTAGVCVAGHEIAVPGAIRVAGMGKAAVAMAAALHHALGERIAAGVVVTKDEPDRDLGAIEILHAAHPVPDERSVIAGERLLALARATGPDDLLLCPISGGGSALACVPDGVRLDELAARGRSLAAAGTPIEIMNAARAVGDAIKAGGLAARARGRVLGLVAVDIASGDPRWVGGGPTMLDRDDVSNVVVADNAGAVAAFAAVAAARGVAVRHGPALVGEARVLGQQIAATAVDGIGPRIWIAGGEPTVTRVGDTGGPGGRTLELALAAAARLAGDRDRVLVAVATDGDDGSSGAAGAVVDGTTAARIGPEALARALAEHRSAAPLAAIGDLLRTGPTGINVCDLVAVIADGRG